MKNYHCNRKKHRLLHVFGCGALFLLLCSQVLPAAEPDTPKDAEPIEITADRAVTDNNAHTAEFSGSVTVIQGQTRMTSDRLILHYGSENTGSGNGGTANDIEKIVAIGRVRIHFDNRLAVSDQAVYTTNDRKLILTGPESKISEGSDEISGGEIIFDRDTEEVTINKGEQEDQVKAIIRSDQRGLN